MDNLTGVTQGNEVRTFAYDSFQRMTQAANPESGTVTYGYDFVGNLLKRTDARNIVTTYGYDELNRPTSISYNDGTTPPVTYTYDDSNNVPYSLGRLTKISNSSSTTNYLAFDALGRVIASDQVTANKTYPFFYGYNLAGALISETYPSGRTIATGYNALNLAKQVSGKWHVKRSSQALRIGCHVCGARRSAAVWLRQ